MQALVDFTAATARSAVGGQAVDYAATEKSIAERTAAIERTAHAEVLGALDVDAPRVCVRGVVNHRLGREARTYFTMAGPVTVERTVYRPSGVRNGPILDPIHVRTGAYGRGWLPLTAQYMAHAVQQGTSRETDDAAKQSGRFPYCRSSFEDVAHMVGVQWLQEHADIEDALTKEFAIPGDAAAISVALDRVSVPMEEPLKRSVGRPRKGAAQRPVARNFRMAYCATITIHDAHGDNLHTLRYGCMPASDVGLWCAEIASDAYASSSSGPT
jgi:hypothetical protein